MNDEQMMKAWLDAAREFRGGTEECILAYGRLVATVAWAEGQGAGTVAAVNGTPLEPNPYLWREA